MFIILVFKINLLSTQNPTSYGIQDLIVSYKKNCGMFGIKVNFKPFVISIKFVIK
jgi:hypothetical protein